MFPIKGRITKRMFYRLKDDIALRAWKGISHACYRKQRPEAEPLKDQEFEILQKCDGLHDLPEDPENGPELSVIRILLQKGMIEPCVRGQEPSRWSRFREYDNLYYPKMNIMITGKCNFNCLHCFNAADNAPLMTQWEFEDIQDLLDQAEDCGIHAFTITGGEPMVHPRFMDILREIYKRDMIVEELNTNGSFIRQEVLDEMRSFDCEPVIKISFDGVGFHDWMRNRKGVEKETLSAMQLCLDNGFPVMSQTQVNRKNLDAMMPTARLLNDMGIGEMRIIRTTEVNRWSSNAGDASLPVEEYYEKLLQFASEYRESGMNMIVEVWQLIRMNPNLKEYKLVPVLYPDGEYHFLMPCCKGTRGMIGVTSAGDIIPCLQISGTYEKQGVHLGNLHETPLKELITDSPYTDVVCSTLGGLALANETCGQCPYFKWCAGGCRALGMLLSWEKADTMGTDYTKCVFFKNGWYEKSVRAMEGWKLMTPAKGVEALHAEGKEKG